MSTSRMTVTHTQVCQAARHLASASIEHGKHKLYGIPRGGVAAAYAVVAATADLGYPSIVVDDPIHADVIVDDLIDSGATMRKYLALYPNKRFAALFGKSSRPALDKRVWVGTELDTDAWLDFPWEADDTGFRNKEDSVVRMLQSIGEDPTREGLRETPGRVVKAWDEWFAGYATNPARHLKTFEDGSEDVNTMVVLPPIPVFSHCEHHIAPFFGHAIIGYIPKGRIVGLSKFSRVVDDFARRLQVQERITTQVANCIFEHLQPLGVGVYIDCQHLCMCSRGIKGPLGRGTKTHAVRGCFTEPDVKAEFLSFCKE